MKHFHKPVLKVLALSLLLAFLFRGPLGGVEDKISYLVMPVEKGVSGAASFIREQITFFSSLRKLARENNELKKKVWELENKISELQQFKQENKELRELLSLSVQGESNILSASIVGWDSLSSGGLFMINKGKEDGIEVGIPVIYEGFLLGTVLEVDSSSSYVRLVYHPSFRTSAISARLGEASLGLIQGYMPGKLIMKDIYSSVPLEVGDKIVTSGKAEKIPGGLVLGEVREIKEKDVLKEAVVSVSVEPRSLNKVFLLQ